MSQGQSSRARPWTSDWARKHYYSLSRSEASSDDRIFEQIFQQVFADRRQVGAIQPDALAHEGLDPAGLVDQFEHRLELHRRQRHLGKHHVALEEVGDDSLAADAQQLEQHRRAHTRAVASCRAMKQQWVDVALGQDIEERAPVCAEVVKDRVMLAAGNQANRLALAKPSIADRDMLPSHLAQHVGVRRAEDRNLGAALERDDGAKPGRPYRTFLGNLGQMRRAEDHVAPDALALAVGWPPRSRKLRPP